MPEQATSAVRATSADHPYHGFSIRLDAFLEDTIRARHNLSQWRDLGALELGDVESGDRAAGKVVQAEASPPLLDHPARGLEEPTIAVTEIKRSRGPFAQAADTTADERSAKLDQQLEPCADVTAREHVTIRGDEPSHDYEGNDARDKRHNQLSHAAVSVLPAVTREPSPTEPDDSPFSTIFQLTVPRPSFLTGVSAKPRWRQLLDRTSHSEAREESAAGEDAADDDRLEPYGPSRVECAGSPPLVGPADDIVVTDPSVPSAQTAECPRDAKQARLAARQRIQDEQLQMRQQQPFEMEADLTEATGSISAGDLAVTPLRPRQLGQAGGETAPTIHRIDFADLTAVTTPGGNVSAAESPFILARSKLGAESRQSRATKRKKPAPRPLLKLGVGAEQVPLHQREVASDPLNNYADAEQNGEDVRPETAGDLHGGSKLQSATESESDTDSERDDPQRQRHAAIGLASRTSKPSNTSPLKRLRRVDAGPRIKALDGTRSKPDVVATTSAALDNPAHAQANSSSSLHQALVAERMESRRRQQAREVGQLSRLEAQQKTVHPPSRRILEKAKSTTFPRTSSGSTTFTRRVALPSRMPSWRSYADCARQWIKWTKEGRIPGKSLDDGTSMLGDASGAPSSSVTNAHIFDGLDLFVVGKAWNTRDYAGWVQRLTLQGGRVLPEMPMPSADSADPKEAPPPSRTLFVVSVGIPKPLDAAGCAAVLGVERLEAVRERLVHRDQGQAVYDEVHFVTRLWAEESISLGKAQDAASPKWQLATTN
ncbi:unnamed protein product [Parajaminaea phylloscopi]